jgi:hypothetical protein
MRTIVLSLLIVVGTVLRSQEVFSYQPLTIVPVANPMTPLPILYHFARNYPDSRPFWGIEGKHYVVRYVDPGTALGHKITYDKHGNILRQEDEVNLKDCPAGLQAYYKENFPDETLPVWCYAEGNKKKYYLQMSGKVIWFDKDGNYIRRRLPWN